MNECLRWTDKRNSQREQKEEKGALPKDDLSSMEQSSIFMSEKKKTDSVGPLPVV